VLASVNCTGPGLGTVGPAGNFSGLTNFQLWVCTFAMVLGRLEMLSFIALLTPRSGASEHGLLFTAAAPKPLQLRCFDESQGRIP
jgi:Trk-type K+ transport system membrane component